ncbi:MAG: histone deacetylase [Candidatus Hodarchaeota archaeon]
MFTLVHDKDFSYKGENPAPKPAYETYESPLRVRSIWEYLKSIDFLELPAVQVTQPAKITEKDVLRIHSSHYLQVVKNLAIQGRGNLGRWVLVNPDTLSLGMKSAGAAVALLQAISGEKREDLDKGSAGLKESKAGFSLNRPPGHHAKHDSTEGLCVFNNIGIAVRYLQEVHDFKEKIAIIDIDSHFGNGTSSIFYKDPSVLHFSVHESSFLGAEGMANEIGEDKGEGTNINYQVPLGATNEIWLRFMGICEQVVKQFDPALIVVATGFDAHWTDPMGNIMVNSRAYAEFSTRLKKLADETCDGRVGFVLEGGYSLAMLGRLVETIAVPFLGEGYTPQPPIDVDIQHRLHPEKERQMLRKIGKSEMELKSNLKPFWTIEF